MVGAARSDDTASTAQISCRLENRDPLDLQGALHGRPVRDQLAQSRPSWAERSHVQADATAAPVVEDEQVSIDDRVSLRDCPYSPVGEKPFNVGEALGDAFAPPLSHRSKAVLIGREPMR